MAMRDSGTERAHSKDSLLRAAPRRGQGPDQPGGGQSGSRTFCVRLVTTGSTQVPSQEQVVALAGPAAPPPPEGAQQPACPRLHPRTHPRAQGPTKMSESVLKLGDRHGPQVTETLQPAAVTPSL
ncbi:hypothetical protein H1C71_018438 [Ictidomys tridecemlineatus]|nr:hypothetical protein H1C71_018438 [Ictidomys tridecemlineatus]